MNCSLLQFVTVAMLILSAPIHTRLLAQPKGVSGAGGKNVGTSSDQLQPQAARIVLPQRHFYIGDEIAFTIVNLSSGNIYYTFGCSVPFIEKINGSDHIALTVDIYESIPALNVLGVGDRQQCGWDQRVWQDPKLDGRARFQHFNRLALVPAGQYQFRLDYYLNEKDVDFINKAHTAYSEIFTIKARSHNCVTVSD